MHITHAIPLNGIPSSLRPFLLAEVAATGQKDIILCSSVLREMIANPNVIPEYRALLDDAGLRFCDSHAPYGRYADLNCPVAELRPVMLAQQRLAIEIAAMLGVKTLAVHVGESGFLEWSLDRLHAFFLDSLEALLPVAEQFGVVLCVENIWFPTCAPDRLLDALERFPSPSLGVCYDSGHANIVSGRNVAPENHTVHEYRQRGLEPAWNDHVLEDLLPHVVNCHLHDNDGQRDMHWVAGRGTIDWPHVTGLLRRAPRLQCVQNEANLAQSPAMTLAEIVETYRRLLE
jgi:sugar phosphate isomerase/epimerase